MQEIYHQLAYFIIYSFLGWVLEVVYHAVTKGQVVNRGFLNGPVCPIYGCGMSSILVLLMPFSNNLLLLTIGGTIFATLIELVGGFVLLKLFHMRWWDYSDQPFNVGGYICPRFSLAWGACIIFAVKIVHPVIELNVNILDGTVGYVLVVAAYVVFIVDIICTVLTVLHLNEDLERINKVSLDLRRVSDEMTQTIAESATETAAKVQEGRVQAALGRAELRDKIEEGKEQAAAGRAELKGMIAESREQAALDRAEFRNKIEEGRVQAALGRAELRNQIEERLRSKAAEMRAKSERLRTLAEEMQARSEESAKKAIYDALEAADEARRADEAAERIANMRAKVKEYRSRALKRHPWAYDRITKAFPDMRSEKYDEELKDFINSMRSGEEDE